MSSLAQTKESVVSEQSVKNDSDVELYRCDFQNLQMRNLSLFREYTMII